MINQSIPKPKTTFYYIEMDNSSFRLQLIVIINNNSSAFLSRNNYSCFINYFITFQFEMRYFVIGFRYNNYCLFAVISHFL